MQLVINIADNVYKEVQKDMVGTSALADIFKAIKEGVKVSEFTEEVINNYLEENKDKLFKEECEKECKKMMDSLHPYGENYIEIGKLEPGSIINIDGLELTVLNTNYPAIDDGIECEGVFCIANNDLISGRKEGIEFSQPIEMCHNHPNVKLRQPLNSWIASSTRDHLGHIARNMFSFRTYKDMLAFRRDLKSWKGSNTRHNKCIDILSLITRDEYKKYKNLIPPKDNCWWTITPYDDTSDELATVINYETGKTTCKWASSFANAYAVLVLDKTAKVELLQEYDGVIEECDDLSNHLVDATLLTSEEYKFCKDKIKNIDCCWWLRSKGIGDYRYKTVQFVFPNGTVYKEGFPVEETLHIRPALLLKDDGHFKDGDNFEFGGHLFTVISAKYNLALCDDAIDKCEFNTDNNSDKFDHYQNSIVRRYIINWFNNAILDIV